MWEATFYVGQGFDRDNRRLSDKDLPVWRTEAASYLIDEFGGFTSFFEAGGWKSAGGTKVIEDTWIVKVVAPALNEGRTAENAAKFLAKTFNQESVMYVVEKTGERFFT